MKNKNNVYIDTSVLNFAFELARADRLFTNEFLRIFKDHLTYKSYISDLTITEINQAYDLRKRQLLKLVEDLNPEILLTSQEALDLSNVYTSQNLIPEKYKNDALHISCATTNGCDFIVSWNFKHMVRAKVIQGIHIINNKMGYNLVEIVSPREFLGK